MDASTMAWAIQYLYGQTFQTRLCYAKNIRDFVEIIDQGRREIEERDNANRAYVTRDKYYKRQILLAVIGRELKHLRRDDTFFQEYHDDLVKCLNQ